MKKVFLFLTAIFFLGIHPQTADASIITVEKNGDVVWNVLSKTTSLDIPKHSSIEVKEVRDSQTSGTSKVSLEKEDNGKISLVVATDSEKKQVDVTGESQELIQIEERPTVQTMTLGVDNNAFTLLQKNIKAVTEFPVSVDPKTAEVVLKTPSGDRFVSIFPSEAAETVLRTKLLNTIANNEIRIVEENQELQYQVTGEKVFIFLNTFEYSVPVSTRLSASTGEILSIEAPLWYKLLGFLLT